MGGGKDQAAANKQLEQQHQYQGQQQKEFDTRNTADLNASRGRGDELYGSLKSGYESLINPATGQPMPGSGGGGGGGGGYSAPALDPRFQNVENQYANYMKTGGWEPGVRQDQQGRINQLGDIGKTGGVSPEDQARARGGGVYDEFAKTGGFGEKDISNIRARGTSGIPSMYGRIRDEANRGAAISGGYGPGRAVLAGRMGRQQASGIADASLNTELGIKGAVNQGRQWGAGGMASSELGLQDLLTRNKMQGLTGASDIQGKMMESIMGGQQWGTGGYHGLVSEQQARADEQAARQAAASASAASSANANDKWAQEFALKQKSMGLEGLGSLYGGQGSGEYNLNKDFALSSAGDYGNQVRDTSVAQKTGNKSAWDTAAQFANAAAGIAGGVMSGGATTALGGLGKAVRPGQKGFM